MSNIQCPIQILNKKVFKMSVETVLKVPLIVVWHGACIIIALIIPDRTSQALYVHVTLQGPHSSHSNSICRNN